MTAAAEGDGTKATATAAAGTGEGSSTVETTSSGGNTNSGGGGSGGTGSSAGGGGGGQALVQQYIPKQNNGQWMAVGSMIGTIFGRLYDSGTLDKAKDAETTWRKLTDLVQQTGTTEFTTNATLLLEPANKLWQDLAAFAEKGYCPDYQYLLNNAVATATAATDTQLRASKLDATRYNVGLNANVSLELRLARVTAIVGSVTVANEQARQFMWSANSDLLLKGATAIETARIHRLTLGGELVAGAGENFANLAQSLRQTAAMDVGDWSSFGSILGVILPLLFAWGCSPTENC